MSLKTWENKAQEEIEKLSQSQPSRDGALLMASWMTVAAGGKVMEAMMGGEMEYYDDGGQMEYARGRGRGRGRGRYARRDSMGRYAYDGRMDDDMDRYDEEEERYYDGGGRYDGQYDGGRGGQSGGRSGGSGRSGGRSSGGMR